MDVLLVILVVIMYVGAIFYIFIKEEKQRNKLIQEYNELVDDIECKQALIEKYEYKIWELLKKLRELNNLSLDQDSDDK